MMVLDTKKAIGDFRQYDKDTQKAFRRTLREFAGQISARQKEILRAKVIDRTPWLELTVAPDRKKWWHYLIGPDTEKAVYAEWIETGGRGGFKGYHYVRDSVKGMMPKLTKALKQDIKDNARYKG